ncbi:MAG: hypothetical protein IJP27_00525 [Clostridia bacterium]|nr:hypothetical protein [Clostridia bacterium]
MQAIRLKDRGILPDTDITLAIHTLFSEYPEDTEFIFEDADYYFSPHEALFADYRLSNSDPAPHRVLAIWMKQMKNCILRGNGARLWLAGHMQVFTLDHCTDILLDGFTVNWKKPLVAEGEVVAKGEGYLDVFVDPEAFPHRLSGDCLEFDVGAGEWYRMSMNAIAFEPHTRTVRRGTGDFSFSSVTPLGESVYRFAFKKPAPVEVGDRLNLRHNQRLHAGIFSEKCERMTAQNITFHSCGGLGCLAQFCKDLIYKNVNFLPDVFRSRYASSGRDDGMHITCNSGTVTITECSFHALMDDPINVHGCCVTVDEVVDARTLRCRYRHRQAGGFHYWAEAGDEIVFIDRSTMSPMGKALAATYRLEDYYTFLLSFAEPLPPSLLAQATKGDALALDNLSHTAAFVCTKNRFGSCRARGILVSTPKKVQITENYFESSGSAILVAGDSNHWFESGACHDVEISRNIFTDACLTSNYQFCEGVISITPVVPNPSLGTPFHDHIRITENTFDVADTPVLSAFSCAELTFSKNRIFKSPAAERWHHSDHDILLNFCKGITLEENEWIGCSAPPKICRENCDE